MTTMHTTDSTTLIAAVRSLAPQIRAARDDIERSRRLPAPLVTALAEAGLFRLYVPKTLGGLEVDPVTFLRVVEEVARIDGAVGWNLAIGAVHGALGAYLREDVARAIYCENPHMVVAGSVNPSGTAHAVTGGYRVSGRWPFGSGIQHSTWVYGNCRVFDGDTPRLGAGDAPEMRFMLFPVDQCEIHDTWHVSGLRGTGSHDFTVADVFVPEEQSFLAFTARPYQPGPLYTCPFVTYFAASIPAPPLGMARGAIDALVELASAKTPTGSQHLLRERPSVQTDIARAEALLRSARAFLIEALQDIWEVLASGGEVTMQQRAMGRIAGTHAAISAAQAVDLMYNAAGGTALYQSGLLERFFRDVHAATQHISVTPTYYELSGRVLLGMSPGTPRF
jgi:alkylation response protein AidB-like acyl-CoA dehydrogenase